MPIHVVPGRFLILSNNWFGQIVSLNVQPGLGAPQFVNPQPVPNLEPTIANSGRGLGVHLPICLFWLELECDGVELISMHLLLLGLLSVMCKRTVTRCKRTCVLISFYVWHFVWGSSAPYLPWPAPSAPLLPNDQLQSLQQLFRGLQLLQQLFRRKTWQNVGVIKTDYPEQLRAVFWRLQTHSEMRWRG